MSRIEAWILASRPKTLSAAAVPVVVGAAVGIAEDGFRLLPVVAALFGAFAIQVGTNFANDLFDFLKGADTEERIGPTRAVQAGLLSTREMAIGTALAFGAAAAAGVYLTAVGGIPILIIGIASILAGIAYTGGPFPLAYNGLGDLFVLVFFGFVAVGGTAWVQLNAWPALAVWAALPVGALATAILVVNNIRDEAHDARADKRTLVVRFGRRFGLYEYAACLAVAYAVPVGLAATGHGPWVLLCWWTVPLAIERFVMVVRDRGPDLNTSLAKTAQLMLLHGLSFAIGVAASG